MQLRTGYIYSPINSVAYAISHYNKPNTAYANYSSWGGDCTNFVSQCMKSGGWLMNSKWKYYGPNLPDRTSSWTGAKEFYQYLTSSGSGRVNIIFKDIPAIDFTSSPSDITAFNNKAFLANKGDIIQLSNTMVKSTVHHSTIVTSKDAVSKKVFVTYRNATGYPVAKDRYVGEFGGYIQGFQVKSSGL